MRREGRAAEPLLKGGATGPVEVPEVLVEPVEIEEEVEVEVLLVVEVPVELVRVLGMELVEVPDPVVVDDVPEVIEVGAPTEKVPDVAYTSLTLPILMARIVYASRTGMAGSVRVNSKRDGSTLLAIAYVSWKSTFTSWIVKVLNRSGSPASTVHLIVTVPPLVGFSGT
jgi:hypothetical protein